MIHDFDVNGSMGPRLRVVRLRIRLNPPEFKNVGDQVEDSYSRDRDFRFVKKKVRPNQINSEKNLELNQMTHRQLHRAPKETGPKEV